MQSSTPSAHAFFEDERSILEEFYTIKREYNSLDKTNPEHTARRDELRARYQDLDKQYGELFEKRVEKLSALLVAQESVTTTDGPAEEVDFPNDWDDGADSANLVEDGPGVSPHESVPDLRAGTEADESFSVSDIKFSENGTGAEDDESHSSNGVAKPDIELGETTTPTAPVEYGPIPDNMMLVPIERALVPTGGDDTLPISSGILELAHTVSCPYCAEQIKPDARKCRHCNEWLKRSDDNKRFNFDAVKHPQLKDVQVSPAVGRFWKVSGGLAAIVGASAIGIFQFEVGLAIIGSYIPEAVLAYLTTGVNGVVLGGAILLIGVSCLGIGKLLAIPKRSPLPVYELARLGCIEELILAFSAGKDLGETDPQGCSSLHAAVLGRQHATVSYLLSIGADVEARTRKGETALQLAVMNEDLDMVDYLVGHGANVHVTNLRGSTLLHVAAWLGNNGLVRRFRDLGLDVKAPGKSGYTPLHFAAQGGHVETVRYLLVLGAQPDERSAKGHTPMYAAAKNGHVAVCRLLLDAGVVLASEDGDNGPSPLKIARSNKRDEVVAFLEESGAEA